ncbi:bifunctional metallophosphatase/5'-nucleotidase [Terrihalobacillus insolitus]|uniref:bifunctional metallophosphatase/5'-nucleotidase n=1 Tax=Terrihalobacillus insolitus TaxID=2950438 RepID=UPI0023425FC1|nr:5'-nucleotidase C-terminal domain-containing protein [Terrihalobacillus insolitus]MDC3415217.1 5'-nucleotidase C-terminal domain-containing protein [Terrihalobacillus insolitus]
MKRKRILTSAAIALSVTLAIGVPSSDAKPVSKDLDRTNRGIDVQLLGVNDFHGQIDTYRTIGGRKAGGAEYLSAYINEKEKENKNTLLVHAGDMVGASSPTSSLLQDEPTVEIMDEMGFDIGTLGNHEFDEGVEELKRLIDGGSHDVTGDFAGASFPYIAANVVDKTTGETILPPYAIERVNGMQIGFVGIITQQAKNAIIPSAIEDVRFTDETEAINKAVAELKEKGVKAIVVLAHDPVDSDKDGSNASGEAVEIANSVDDEVDIIIGGHSHRYANTTVDNKLLVQSYSYGTAFSDIDLVIDPKTKDIVEKSAEIITTYHDGITPDPTVKQMVEQYQEEVGPLIDRVVGEAAEPITGNTDKSGESALGNLIADSQRQAMGTDFAFMNPGGIRADLDAGDITWGELFTIQPFGNTLVEMTFTGKQIKEVLEQQFYEGGNTILQISGLRYTWDPDAPIGDKVRNLTDQEGIAIQSNKEYTVTVNNFLASGGDGFTKFTEGTNEVIGPVDLDAIVTYIEQQPTPIAAPNTNRINVN